jgi:hypothetical protein
MSTEFLTALNISCRRRELNLCSANKNRGRYNLFAQGHCGQSGTSKKLNDLFKSRREYWAAIKEEEEEIENKE